MNILVCGGAGYIGSHMLKMLQQLGHRCTVLDNFSTGHEWAIGETPCARVDLLDQAGLGAVFQEHEFDVVMHFSALSLVGESCLQPARYFRNNVGGTLNLLECMIEHQVRHFIFSSTAAIFGEPVTEIISEDHPRQPLNPYGQSKLMVENILADFHTAYGLNSVSLRYFNAAGADPSGEIGECHDPETHLIPRILMSLLEGGPEYRFSIFGSDYNTPDGTCIRDYIHVNDLARAHVRALDHVLEKPGVHAFNLGNNRGFSVLDIVHACEQITGKKVDYEMAGKRPGDPAVLVADNCKAKRELGWEPEFATLEAIIETAWKWHGNYQLRKSG